MEDGTSEYHVRIQTGEFRRERSRQYSAVVIFKALRLMTDRSINGPGSGPVVTRLDILGPVPFPFFEDDSPTTEEEEDEIGCCCLFSSWVMGR